VTAWLKRDEQGRLCHTLQTIVRLRIAPLKIGKCMDFGVWTTDLFMPALTKQIQPVINEHCTHCRIWLDASQASPGQFYGPPHDICRGGKSKDISHREDPEKRKQENLIHSFSFYRIPGTSAPLQHRL